MLKTAIVGAGYIGEFHALGYLAVPEVKLALVVDQNLEKAQKLAGLAQADATTDLDALLASDVELVSICTPTPSHAPLAVALLRSGKHVLCEKPIARSMKEAQQMIDAAEESGRKLMIGHVSRYEADHLKAKAIIERGAIGKLRMGAHALVGPYPGWSTNNWLGDVARSGGPVLDLAIHSVDYLMWLFEEPVVQVYASGSGPVTGQDHYVLLNLQFAGGGLGLVEASWAHPSDLPLTCRVELSGDQGRLSWDYSQITGMTTWRKGAGEHGYVLEGENSFAAQIADFARCIQADLPAPIPGSAGLAALRVCLAALESLQSGRCVELDWEG